MDDSPLNILVVDDEPALREVLALRVEAWGHAARTAGDVPEAESRLAEAPVDLILSDVVLPSASGLDLLKRVRSRLPRIPVVMMTAHGHVDTAVEAMKVGALDFLTKPLDYDALQVVLTTVAEDTRQRRVADQLVAGAEAGASRYGLVGSSRPMLELFRQLDTLAGGEATVLVTGESGTGKELVARAIHTMSRRANGPFVAVNAAAIPEGLIESEIFGHEAGAFTGATRGRAGCFELADGGTLFLDEIGEMPAQLQPRLLRILEDGKARRLGGSAERQCDVRVIAATNRDPRIAIQEGRLREDLYYRLGVFELALPPLRERPDDIPILAQYFARRFASKHGLPIEGVREDACERLGRHAWPGNVREFRNTLERAVILAQSGWVEVRHLPPALRGLSGEGTGAITIPAGTTLADAEREVILRTLDRVGGNKAEAARQLGVDVKTVRARLRGYGHDA